MVAYLMCTLLSSSELQASSLGVLAVLSVFSFGANSLFKDVAALKGGLSCLMIALIVGTVFSEDVSRSAKGIYDLIRGVLLFFVGACFYRCFRRYEVTSVLLGFFSISALLGIGVAVAAAMIQGAPWLLENPVLELLFHETHLFANFIAMICLGLLVLVLVGVTSASYWIGFVCVCLFATLIALQAKGTLLALLLSGSWCFSGSHRSALRNVWYAALVLVLVSLTVLSFFPALDLITHFSLPPSLLERRRIYAELLLQLWESPFTGFGLNTYKDLVLQFGTAPHYTMPHSIYLESLFSFGFVGSAFLLAAGLLVARKACSPVSSIENQAWKFWRTFAGAALIFTAIRGLVDMRLGYGVWGSFALPLGILFASTATSMASRDIRVDSAHL